MARGHSNGSGVGRRRFLRTTGAIGLAGVAGCSGGGDGGGDGDSGGGYGGGGGGGDESPTPTAADGADAEPPGADMAGGPDDLTDRRDVSATVLEEDQGAGRFVFTPAVVWVETGGTVVWSFEGADHTVTAYHPQFDQPLRIPDAVETPFDSEVAGAGSPGTSFNFVFEVPGVYNYFCKPHEGLGMVGLVVVGEPAGGPGTGPPADLGDDTAAARLTRLLDVAGLGNG